MYPLSAGVAASIDYRLTIGTNRSESRGHRNTINKGHPECHERIERIWERMRDEGLLESVQVVEKFLPIDDGDLRCTHTREHVDGVAGTESKGQAEIDQWAATMDSVFATPLSYAAALSAVACTRTMAEWIVAGKIPAALSLVRPPGHHADAATPCGFCLFNNAAQAVEAARMEGAKRVLLVDLDVHHGQGTQRIFYDDDDVLYFSMHRYEYGAFWPNLRESASDAIGEGAGRGYTVNVPLQETGCGDADYLFVLFSLLLPVARDFAPDLVIVSAGFDSVRGDPLGGMDLTPIGYAHILHHLRTLADGRMLVVLEGGYNHEMSAATAAKCVRVLRGERPKRLEGLGKVKESVRESTMNTVSCLLPHWPSLRQYDSEAFRKRYPTASMSRFEPPERDIPTANIDQADLLKPESIDIPVAPRSYATRVFHSGPAHHGHAHPDGNSFERPERITTCLERLATMRVPVDTVEVGEDEIDEDTVLRWINAVHDEEYVERLRSTREMSSDEKPSTVAQRLLGSDDSFITAGTWTAAIAAVATTIKAVDGVLSGSLSSAFSLVRPPGHHCGRGARGASGFCFVNNVAVAAKYLLARLPAASSRVLIIDWDVHLGDGTVACLASIDIDRLQYLSVHRSDDGTFFPAGASHQGDRRSHVLLPLSGGAMTDAEYLAAIDRIIMPVVYSYAPSFILVSAGFDCLKGDPLGGYSVSPCTLATLTRHLQAVAPVVAVLEGGYNGQSTAEGVAAVVEAMQGEAGKSGDKRGRLNPAASLTISDLAAKVQDRFDMVVG